MNTTNPGLILHISESDNKTIAEYKPVTAEHFELIGKNGLTIEPADSMFMTESGEVEG